MGKIIELLDKNSSILNNDKDTDEVMLIIVKDKKKGHLRICMKCVDLAEIEDIVKDAITRHPILSAPILSGFTKRFLEIFQEANNEEQKEIKKVN